jgi:hypothetical protein
MNCVLRYAERERKAGAESVWGLEYEAPMNLDELNF